MDAARLLVGAVLERRPFRSAKTAISLELLSTSLAMLLAFGMSIHGQTGIVFTLLPYDIFIHIIYYICRESRDIKKNYKRDDYIKVVYENIQENQDYNFQKMPPNEIDSLQEPYDLDFRINSKKKNNFF